MLMEVQFLLHFLMHIYRVQVKKQIIKNHIVSFRLIKMKRLKMYGRQ